MPGHELVIVQLNLYRMRWRWPERAQLVLDELTRLQPDVVTLQEVTPFRRQAQHLARDLSRRLPGRPYRAYVSRKYGWRGLLEGIAILARLPSRDFASRSLGHTRVAQRLRLDLAGQPVTLVNAHLSSGGEAREIRLGQALRIVDWVGSPVGPLIVAGDLNAQPHSRTLGVFADLGLESAYRLAHSRDPERTVPSFEAPRPGYVLDYILVSDAFEVVSCELAFTNPSADDTSLFASDHFGLVARLRVRGGNGSQATASAQRPRSHGLPGL